ncbi:hypothetical protein FHW12_000137 [Dokdonella fugitiva]|uniref:DUF7660 domain-containing protein n=1 Tax=Dokdonella fugitiva TaxID=328517 RepID=A0A839EU50_9GAMM|nr:hypothetical protein [Dokdonella fugitiva]MBA8885946.1 hypothetical protein [Dokdonella fugitiva]
MLLSLQRALLGEICADLRQASIEADATLRVVRVRFEFDGMPSATSRESCSCVAGMVLGDFPDDWTLDEQHESTPCPDRLSGLAHIGYLRGGDRRHEPGEHVATRHRHASTIGKVSNSANLDSVSDASSFVRFVEALVADRRLADSLAPTVDGFAGEWANQSIADFLEAACAWANDSAFGEQQSLQRENPWRQFAVFLWAGRIYE